MNKYLKAASDRYPDEIKDKLIHPISDIDGQIVTEIIELFKKLRFKNVVDILNDYKYKSDEDIALALLDVNTNITNNKDADNSNPLFLRYLNTCGRRLDLFLLIGYDSVDWVSEKDGIIYVIRLNPTPDNAKQVPFYANEILEYDNLEDRDSVLKKLDDYMELYRGLFLR